MTDAHEFARRSYRGHLGRLKLVGQNSPEIMQHVLGIERAVAQLFGFNAEEDVSANAPTSVRDASHFKANGRNLSPEGQAFIFSLYDAGFSIRGAAARIGISLKAAADYRSAWLRRGSAQIS
jgi:hypothetical protein